MTDQDVDNQKVVVRETAEQKFQRVGSRRTRAILKDFRLLGNTANSQSYRFSPQEAETIFAAIEKALANTKAKFFRVREDDFAL